MGLRNPTEAIHNVRELFINEMVDGMATAVTQIVAENRLSLELLGVQLCGRFNGERQT